MIFRAGSSPARLEISLPTGRLSSALAVLLPGGAQDAGNRAFLWDEFNGMRSLKAILEDDFGLDLTGWILQNASGISADGSTIVGSGINPNGDKVPWLAALDFAAIEVPFDIKPGSCPNSLNTRSRGVLPVAICAFRGIVITSIG